MTQKSFHLKGLNGLRAIAALGVVFSHIILHGADFGLQDSKKGLDLAGFGVTIFFSLSGFLITYLLLIEKKKYNIINIKAFYIRRILRIWPLYFLYLILSVITIWVLKLDDLPGSLLYYIFLAANIPFIIGTNLPLFHHYWSLGVEEQFYLFYPWVIHKIKRLIPFLIWFIIIFIILKIAFRIIDMKTSFHWPYTAIVVTRFECMAIGALGAVYSFNNTAWFKKIIFHPITQLAAWGVLTLIVINKFHIASIIDSDIVAVVTVIMIVNVALNVKSFVRLDFAIPDFLGKISFGIYVYHPLVIFLFSKFIKDKISSFNEIGKYSITFLGVIGITIFIAWSSYNYFEKYFLKRKDKFAMVRSSSVEKPEL